MTIVFVNQAEGSTEGAPSIATSSPLNVALGDILEIHVLANNGITVSITDGGSGNIYTLQPVSPTISDLQAYCFVAQNCVASSALILTSTASIGSVFGIYTRQIRGSVTSGAVIGMNGAAQTLSAPTTNGILSGNIALGATPVNALLTGFCYNIQNGTPIPTIGTTQAFSGRPAVWGAYNGGGSALSLPEDVRLVGATVNVQTAFSAGSGSIEFSSVFSIAIAYAELPPPPGNFYSLETTEYF